MPQIGDLITTLVPIWNFTRQEIGTVFQIDSDGLICVRFEFDGGRTTLWFSEGTQGKLWDYVQSTKFLDEFELA